MRALLFVTLVAATAAHAEKSAVNVHLDPMVGTGLDKVIFVSGASLKVDTTLIKALGPVAPQLEGFGFSALNRTYLGDGSAFGGGIGARVRLFNDERGYFFNPGQKYHGNFLGNLWLDAHLTYTSGGMGVGFDVGAGYSFSLVEGMSVGPAAKFIFNTRHSLLMFGISFTIGAPDRAPDHSDYDDDGVLGVDDDCPGVKGLIGNKGCPTLDQDNDGVGDSIDKCPAVAGLSTNSGCPDGDSDNDSVLDSSDACPTKAGPAANKGCPDTDSDGDGVVDRDDACPNEKGVVEGQTPGCPDADTDSDGVVDRLDRCADVKGEADNDGCPLADGDADAVPDRFDNCPAVKGVAANAGCPAGTKQLVQITRERLLIKDKVYFDVGRATVQSKSNALLDQIAAVMKAHDDITLLQIEGHTDTSGDPVANTTLSQARAEAVKAYVVKKGVDAARLKAVGFGPDRPAETNDTPAGRENNRRVEFTIVK